MTDGTDYIPISALQHYMFCQRQCALIHVDRLWVENFLTAKGRQMHTKVNEADDETRDGVRICRSQELGSDRLGVYGISDVVEYHSDGTVIPVEYKRGKPKDSREDEIQLCAQVLCLEEMLGREISFGYIFYGKTRRRLQVEFDGTLRHLTEDIITKTAKLMSGETKPEYKYSRKCKSCSLLELCMPKRLPGINRYISGRIGADL